MQERILVLYNEKSNHTIRLLQGLIACGKQPLVCNSIQDPNINNHYDMVFVDVAFDQDLEGKLHADCIIPFDAEDDPNFFEPGIGYESIKDKCKFYAKLVYTNPSSNLDGLKYIAIPIHHFLTCAKFSEVPEFTERQDTPMFVGSPAYLNFWISKKHHKYCKHEDFNPISYWPNDDSWLYSQRFDWLETLKRDNERYHGGIVFKNDPKDIHSIEFQSKAFGPAVANHALNGYIPPDTLLKHHLASKYALAPTGHDRYSWRIFDIMAAGSILLCTDLGSRTMLYNPKAKYTVSDGESITNALTQVRLESKELLDASRENREVFKGLTPTILWRDFKAQME